MFQYAVYSLFYTQGNKVYIKLKRSKIKETASYTQEARKKVTLNTAYSSDSYTIYQYCSLHCKWASVNSQVLGLVCGGL